ncbi:MAG: hypothetical protein E4H03_12895 [Myxococcales bacterium]|nr:MAG: hypothetical protein E4H03_12895 [Myxococcales bacterium]
MRKSPRRAVLDDAGRACALGRELDELEAERRRLDDRIRSLEQRLAEAMRKFETSFEKAVEQGSDGHTGGEAATADQAVTPGKLPHRVLTRMRSEPERLFTAALLQAELDIDDVQQVRTALARLAAKRLVRRTDVKGEFTI